MPGEAIQPAGGIQLAIVHYHLQPGGVTTVIGHAVDALAAQGVERVAVLAGRADPGDRFPHVTLVPGLDYAEGQESSPSPRALADALEEAARCALGGRLPDVWHCHNHALGKNAGLPDALALLLTRGHRLLLQIHDFAEDGRPHNFAILARAQMPYPLHPRAHYATINSRDQALLAEAGVPRERLHLLPNPVPAPRRTASRSRPLTTGSPLVLYPCRGIRRKNLGEMVLLAALSEGEAAFATTRRPENRRWQATHDAWETFARERQLPVHFGVVDRFAPAGLKLPSQPGPISSRKTTFASWLRAATCLVTTSVAEGFGLTFLESVAQGLPLIGRDLPAITSDFKERGLLYPGLYLAIRIPARWIGTEPLLTALRTQLRSTYRAYGREMPSDGPERSLEAMMNEREEVDFGRLSESFQRRIIEHILDENAADQVRVETDRGAYPLGEWLDEALRGQFSAADQEAQAEILRGHHSLEAYGARLLAAYQNLTQESGQGVDELGANLVRSRLLDSFLSPETFHFLKI